MELHNYQKKAIEHIKNNKKCALFLTMGLGKTLITLYALDELKRQGLIKKILIIAPKKVAESTWEEEIRKWGFDFKISYLLGVKKEREKGLSVNSDIYIINRENVVWLENTKEKFDTVIIDESTSFKNHKSLRFKALRRMEFERVVLLTGTPSPNTFMDLWSQIYLLDKGKRLGAYFNSFRLKYYTNVRQFVWELKKGAEKEILRRIEDITLSMRASDYLELPDINYNDVYIKLDKKALITYKELEKKMVLEVEEVTATSTATLTNKLLQLSNGAIYDDKHEVKVIHDAKIERLKEIVENIDRVLIFYNYIHDKERILKEFKEAVELKGKETQEDWNNGKIKILLAHPGSCAYGLNLQKGGHHIVWFGLTWNYEHYVQANARLHRQGQKEKVFIHHLICKGTKDEEVKEALQRKDNAQAFLFENLKRKIEEYRENGSM